MRVDWRLSGGQSPYSCHARVFSLFSPRISPTPTLDGRNFRTRSDATFGRERTRSVAFGHVLATQLCFFWLPSVDNTPRAHMMLSQKNGSTFFCFFGVPRVLIHHKDSNSTTGSYSTFMITGELHTRLRHHTTPTIKQSDGNFQQDYGGIGIHPQNGTRNQQQKNQRMVHETNSKKKIKKKSTDWEQFVLPIMFSYNTHSLALINTHSRSL